MDADAYVAGKEDGSSKLERHGSAILVTMQGDVTVVNRQLVVGPPKEIGILPDDIDRLEEAAIEAVAQAQNALEAAQQRLDNVRALKVDARAMCQEIRDEYAAKVAAAQKVIAEGDAALG